MGCSAQDGMIRPARESPGAYVFYPDLPEKPRIQFLASYSSFRDVIGKPSLFQTFILGEGESEELGKPYGVAMQDGKIFVCDTRRNAVVVLDLVSRSVSTFGDKPPGVLAKPINVAVDEEGLRYVADTELGRVMVYDSDGHYLKAIGDPDEWTPSDVAVFGERLYVPDLENAQVVVVERKSGRELRRFASKGSGADNLFFPTNIEVDGDGNVYVADTGNFRVLEFDREGKLLRQFGSLGRSLGSFARPKGVAVDKEGRVYVVDAAFEKVQVFDREGKLLLFFGAVGNVAGGINLPAKVEIDYDHVALFSDKVAPGYGLEYLILVTSQFGRNKVNVYGFLRSRGGGSG